jgi:hypothetical protein
MPDDSSKVRSLFGSTPQSAALANAAVVAQCEQLLQWAKEGRLTGLAFAGFTPQDQYMISLIGEVKCSASLLGVTALWEHTKSVAIAGL